MRIAEINSEMSKGSEVKADGNKTQIGQTKRLNKKGKRRIKK